MLPFQFQGMIMRDTSGELLSALGSLGPRHRLSHASDSCAVPMVQAHRACKVTP